MTFGQAIRFVLTVLLAGLVMSVPPVLPSPVPVPPPEPATAAAPVVVTLGDSVPAGTACGCVPFPSRYATMLSPAARSVNLAVPGYTAEDVRSQIRDSRVRADLDAASVVIVMAGANDMAEAFGDDGSYPATATTVRDTMADIVTAVRRGRRTPTKVLVVGYWNVVKDGAAGLAAYGAAGLRSAELATRYCNRALRAAAAESGATYVTTVPALKGADRSRDPTGLLAADGDHPNAAGHQAIAAAIYAAG